MTGEGTTGEGMTGGSTTGSTTGKGSRRPRSRQVLRRVLAVVLALLVAGAVTVVVLERTGRVSLPFTLPLVGRDYCGVVEDHQQDLSVAIGSGSPTALIEALPVLRTLQRTAPEDVAADWQLVVTRVEALAQALDDAGVDAATYDAENPPAGVSEDEQAAITAAALELVRPGTVQAFRSVEQQVRDVCHTPLFV